MKKLLGKSTVQKTAVAIRRTMKKSVSGSSKACIGIMAVS